MDTHTKRPTGNGATTGNGADPRPTVLVRRGVSRPVRPGEDVLGPLPRPSRFPLREERLAREAPGPIVHRPRRPWPLPRRQRETEVFRASTAQVAWRLVCWTYAVVRVAAFRLLDRVRGRTSPAQRGIRLRETCERMGGTFLKLGQQLSTRLDLLAFPTCAELSKMLDDMSPFAVKDAVAAIERVTGKPIGETFARFDPEPLGSMAVCCIYHAVLHDGTDVVVKVRRPGIGDLFAADFAALDVLCAIAESLTLIRPGFTRALRTELRTMVMEELDFQSEARYQELFRRQAKRDRQPISAPRVYPRYSGRDVLVSEYIRGVWLQDLIDAKDRKDEATLAYLATQGITPRRVARRLLRGFYWSTFETLFYHADPHPGNVVVRSDGRLFFANFGACGPTTHKNRRNYAELFRRHANRDLDGMVQVFGSILSPLPQIDVHRVMKAAEAKVARWQYGFDSKHAEWWERTFAGLWIGIMEMAREQNIAVNIETVRFVRASLLCDTTAARLDETVRGPREFARYQRRARRRAGRRAIQRLQRGDFSVGQAVVGLERAGELVNRLVYRLHELSDQPTTSFLAALNKGSFVVSSLLRFAFTGFVLTVLGAAIVATSSAGAGRGVGALLGTVGRNPLYWGGVVLLCVRTYRVVQYRLGDIDRQG